MTRDDWHFDSNNVSNVTQDSVWLKARRSVTLPEVNEFVALFTKNRWCWGRSYQFLWQQCRNFAWMTWLNVSYVYANKNTSLTSRGNRHDVFRDVQGNVNEGVNSWDGGWRRNYEGYGDDDDDDNSVLSAFTKVYRLDTHLLPHPW